ncbi:secretion-regulating guanine nucleotide exchange factor [Gastrophryne carolinensis]
MSAVPMTSSFLYAVCAIMSAVPMTSSFLYAVCAIMSAVPMTSSFLYAVCAIMSAVPMTSSFLYAVCAIMSAVPMTSSFLYAVCAIMSAVPMTSSFLYAVHAIMSAVPMTSSFLYAVCAIMSAVPMTSSFLYAVCAIMSAVPMTSSFLYAVCAIMSAVPMTSSFLYAVCAIMSAVPVTSSFLYAGSNSCGQLGLGSHDDTLRPHLVSNFPAAGTRIKSISGGGSHTAIVTESGEVYVCGQNRAGQLGLGHHDDIACFMLCSSIANIRVAKMSCGWDFSLILTEDGRLLSCGSNAFHQLGLPHRKASSLPQPIQNLHEKVVDAAAGLRHSLALTESGQTFQWGSGLASQAKRFCNESALYPFYTALEPCLVPGLENVKVKQVATGSSHSVALSAAGDLHVWGSNKHGQLLHSERFVLQPWKIAKSFFSDECIGAVWSGWSHLTAQTESGKVYSWGRCDYGQLGGNHTSAELKEEQGSASLEPGRLPLCVASITGAAQIACGSEHNLAICGDSALAWGWNEHGMCGNGSEDSVPVPAVVLFPDQLRVKLIGCGAGHSIAVCISPG